MTFQPSEFFESFSTEHRRHMSEAAAERLRGPGGFRAGTASALRALADRLAPSPAPPRAASSRRQHAA